ncbi:hypothetical protein FNV43_RR06544 [Rhamnella rubrinervis]|uniref:Gnk2-homologous domain-containing protein n=1 Tax=Rhamnella rubrinervis TaxID=2594499 RepID=A0A8K0HDM0_9ROSA|nr:hypothetical protein FNV43_RR06544 [Rhamnella rubrinervis]
MLHRRFSTTENEFQINCKNVFDALAANASLQNGFYETETGKKSEKLYCLIECRAEFLPMIAVTAQTTSPKWCFLHNSNASLLRPVEYSSGAWTNDIDLDVPSMVSKGLEFMGELAQNASKPIMFQTAVLDAGQIGKTQGMVQCTRDISKADCRKCLDHQLETLKAFISSKRGWEIHNSSCFMRYQDYQFYFNMSTPASEGGRPSSHKGVAIGLISAIGTTDGSLVIG